MQLTGEGLLFFEHAQRLLEEATELNTVLASAGSQALRGTLRLGYYNPIATSVLPPLLQGLTKHYPAVNVELIGSVEDDLHERMLDGFVDVAIGYKRSPRRELHSVHVASRRPYAIVAADHPLAGRGSVSLADLVDEPLILITVGGSDQRNIGWFTSVGLKPRVRWETHDIDLTFALVGQGHGYALMQHRQHHDMTVDGHRISVLELDPPVDPIPVYVTVSARALGRERVREFVRLARDTFRNMPEWTGFIPAAPTAEALTKKEAPDASEASVTTGTASS